MILARRISFEEGYVPAMQTKLIQILLALTIALISAVNANSQNTVPAQMRLTDINGNAVTTRARICATLQDDSNRILANLRVLGSMAIITENQVCDATPDNTGLVSMTLFGNDVVNPAGSMYSIVEEINNQHVHSSAYVINTTDAPVVNLDTKSPETAAPIVPARSGDITYAAPLLMNQPFKGGVSSILGVNQSGVASASANLNSPQTRSCAAYWNSSASALDCYTWQILLGTGANPNTTYTLTHSGSPGTATVDLSAVTLKAGVATVSGLFTCKNMDGIRCADSFAGADCGAKIMAADADFSNPKGEIWVNRNCGLTISTALNVQHNIRFIEGGTWTFTSTWTQTHGGISIIGLGTLDSSSNPGTILHWGGAAGSDLLDITGTANARLDKIVMRGIIFDGGGLARYDVRQEKIDTVTVQDVRWRNAVTAGWYLVDSTGTNGYNLSCGTISTYCAVFDWGTGGSAIYGWHVENDLSSRVPLILLQGSSRGFLITNLECDATNTSFGGCFQITGFDRNSSFPGAPAGGAGAPQSVKIILPQFTEHAAGGSAMQGAEFLITGTAANPSNDVTLEGLNSSGAFISAAAVKTDQTIGFGMNGGFSSSHTMSTVITTANTSLLRILFFNSNHDPAKCTGGTCGSRLEINQDAGGLLSLPNSGIAVGASIIPATAAATTVGTNALPFSSAFIGAGATNNVQLTGTFTAARKATFPDASGEVAIMPSATRVLQGSAILTYTAIAANACQEQTISVTNANTTNFGVFASPRAALGNANLSWSAWVSVPGTVSVRVCNVTTGSVTPSAVAWGATVVQ